MAIVPLILQTNMLSWYFLRLWKGSVLLYLYIFFICLVIFFVYFVEWYCVEFKQKFTTRTTGGSKWAQQGPEWEISREQGTNWMVGLTKHEGYLELGQNALLAWKWLERNMMKKVVVYNWTSVKNIDNLGCLLMIPTNLADSLIGWNILKHLKMIQCCIGSTFVHLQNDKVITDRFTTCGNKAIIKNNAICCKCHLPQPVDVNQVKTKGTTVARKKNFQNI